MAAESSSSSMQDIIIVFIVFILPLWLFLHYRYKTRINTGRLGQAEREQLESVLARVETLHHQMERLEKIVDEVDPEWKQHS